MEAMVAERIAEFPEYAEIERYRTHWLRRCRARSKGRSLIERLAAREVPQYSITNFGADAFAMFRPTFPILDHMRDIVVSGEERLVKPAPRHFRSRCAAIRPRARNDAVHRRQCGQYRGCRCARLASPSFHGRCGRAQADLVERGLL
jgi:2-haloacid dehalogenase